MSLDIVVSGIPGSTINMDAAVPILNADSAQEGLLANTASNVIAGPCLVELSAVPAMRVHIERSTGFGQVPNPGQGKRKLKAGEMRTFLVDSGSWIISWV